MRGRRLLVLLWAVVLVLGLMLQTGASAEEWDNNIIFSALNDTPLPLNDATMPIRVGGSIYIPHTQLISGGVRLGIFDGGQSKANNTLTLYSADKNLTFDLKTGLSYDYYPDGARQTPIAVIRNGQIYVSAWATASYFGLTYTQDNIVFGTKYYPYIRVSNENAVLSQGQFKDSVHTSYLVQLQNYYRTVVPPTGGETTSPTPSPAPSTVVPGPGTEDGQVVGVYLALRCDTGEATGEILDVLKAEGRAALLLFPAASLTGQDDLIRRAVGEGHVLGLLTAATDPDLAREELAEGQQALGHIVRTSTAIVLAEDEAVSKALSQDGWLCWVGNLSGLPQGRESGSIYNSLSRTLQDWEHPARITLDDSRTSSAVLSRLLQLLRQERFYYRTAVETEF